LRKGFGEELSSLFICQSCSADRFTAEEFVEEHRTDERSVLKVG